MKSITSLLLLSFLVALNSQAQNLKLEKLDSHIESLLPKSINDSTPGLVIGVVHKGELIFSKGYGLANLSYGIPNDPKVIYNIGSVSKQFLGYAFAMLHAEGKINLDDPVAKHLEDWPKFDQPVTIRHLLTHTSGYREAYTMSALAGRSVGVDRLTREECLDVVRRQPKLEFAPGSRYTYNSTAYVILAEIFEKAVDQPAHEWVEANILRPLGMNDTRIESYVGEVLPNAAESYSHSQKRGYRNPKSNRAIFGGAEVFTSVEDMEHWLNNMRSPKVGTQAATDVFLEPFKLTDGSNSEYGLGIENKNHRGQKLYVHTGGHESFITQLRYYPEHELGLFTVSNFGGQGVLRLNQLAEFILADFLKPKENQDHTPFDPPKGHLKQVAGMYVSPRGNDFVKLTLKDDTLTTWGGRPLTPIGLNAFYMESWGGKFEIIYPKQGPVQLHVIGDSRSTFNKVETWEPSSKDLQAFEADYWSEELETVYHLQVTDDRLTIHHRWLGEIGLTPIANDFFQTDWGWYMQMVRDEAGTIKGFNVNSGRTLGVFFGRK